MPMKSKKSRNRELRRRAERRGALTIDVAYKGATVARLHGIRTEDRKEDCAQGRSLAAKFRDTLRCGDVEPLQRQAALARRLCRAMPGGAKAVFMLTADLSEESPGPESLATLMKAKALPPVAKWTSPDLILMTAPWPVGPDGGVLQGP